MKVIRMLMFFLIYNSPLLPLQSIAKNIYKLLWQTFLKASWERKLGWEQQQVENNFQSTGFVKTEIHEGKAVCKTNYKQNMYNIRLTE